MKLIGALLLSMIAGARAHAQEKTIADRVAEFGEGVRARLAPRFAAAGINYPPQHVTLIGFKRERRLELYAEGAGGPSRIICAYPVLAASGSAGPKLREGDRQVPEGVYPIELLNPNSSFHVALWVGYPNQFDCARAVAERRTDVGGDIMIHGGAESRGCLAVGDDAAEDLFVLAALVGIENTDLILAPADLRSGTVEIPASAPSWTNELYEQIAAALARFPAPAQ